MLVRYYRYAPRSITETAAVIDLLFVHPDFGRRGIGRALVACFCATADKRGLRSIVEASPQGKRTYELCGFVSKETVVVSAALWPGEPEQSYYWMEREPASR